MSENIVLNAREMRLIEERLAAQVLENHPDAKDLMLIGIQRRGADIATRLARLLAQKGSSAQLGTLDINFYRDDWTCRNGGMPSIGESHIPQRPDDKVVLLVDDVLFSGRTIRAALEAILDYGRPRSVEVLAFIDRGHRELPISANYTGRNIVTEKGEQVDVLLEERDGRDAVIVRRED